MDAVVRLSERRRVVRRRVAIDLAGGAALVAVATACYAAVEGGGGFETAGVSLVGCGLLGAAVAGIVAMRRR
jgi:hypothetical protein